MRSSPRDWGPVLFCLGVMPPHCPTLSRCLLLLFGQIDIQNTGATTAAADRRLRCIIRTSPRCHLIVTDTHVALFLFFFFFFLIFLGHFNYISWAKPLKAAVPFRAASKQCLPIVIISSYVQFMPLLPLAFVPSPCFMMSVAKSRIKLNYRASMIVSNHIESRYY